MKKSTPVIGAVAVLALMGCEASPEPVTRSEMNTAMMEYHSSVTVDEAILQQQSLYSYHFMTGTDRLNAIGQRDVAVLARHYRDNAGTVNIIRGDAGDALYESRVAAVMKAFDYAGVDASKVTTSEGLPGGAGISSDWTLMVHNRVDGMPLTAPDH